MVKCIDPKESSSSFSFSSSSSSSISHKSKQFHTSSTLKAFTKNNGKCMFYKLGNSSRGSRSDGLSGPSRGVSTRVWEEKFFPGVSPIPPHLSGSNKKESCMVYKFSSNRSRNNGRSGSPRVGGVLTATPSSSFCPSRVCPTTTVSSEDYQNQLTVKTGSAHRNLNTLLSPNTHGDPENHNNFSITTPPFPTLELSQAYTPRAVGPTTDIDFQTFPDL